jgi:GNAT superfamily N-acetyltransferase
MIRSAVSEDLNALLELYKHLNPNDLPLPAREELEGCWQKILDNPMHHLLVAETEGDLVGSCALTLAPNLTRGMRPYGFIENVVVHEDYRRRGIGTALLHRAKDIAWDAGAYKVMLMTSADSEYEHLHRFYEQAGFDGDERRAFIAHNPDVTLPS